MALAYSNDFRNHAISLHLDRGMRIDEVSKLLKIGIATLYRWISRKKKTGKVDPIEQKRPGCRNKVLENEYEEFRKFLDDNRGLNAIELAKKWKRFTSASAMRKWIKKIGYTLKKNSMYTKKGMKENA